MRNHVMVDLETLDTRQDAAIIAIGAIKFDPRDCVDAHDLAYPSRSFFRLIMPLGKRSISYSTLCWWMKEDQAAARQVMFNPDEAFTLTRGLRQFKQWATEDESAEFVWSHGLCFDVSMLISVFELYGLEWPFHYRNARDTRTLFEISPPDEPPTFGPAHHPPHDAWRQAWRVQSSYRNLLKSFTR